MITPMADFASIKATLHKGIIVSCQPVPDGPMDRDDIVVAMAEAAALAGAAGLRIEGAKRVSLVRQSVDVPLIGIVKRDLADSEVRITPWTSDVEDLIAAGAGIVAIDGTDRPRPASLEVLIAAADGVPVMADCATLAEGLKAADLGCGIIGTTLAGYTGGPVPDDPDFQLIGAMSDAGLRVMAEGRMRTPDDAARAIDSGAWAVTVGSAITRIEHITSWFDEAVRQASGRSQR